MLRGAERVPRGRVLVVGQGFVGRLFAAVLARRGDEVFATDTRPERAGRAPDGPVDAAVLCAPAAPLDAVEPGGTVLVFSPAAPRRPRARLPQRADADGLALGDAAAHASALAASARARPAGADVLPLERFAEGLELYRSGRALKVVFTP